MVKWVDLAGIQAELESRKGRTVVVNHFATWCRGCVMELPLLRQLYRELAPEVDFIGVSWDPFIGGDEDEAAERRRIESDIGTCSIEYPVLIYNGEPQDLIQAFAIEGGTVPYTMVIDPHGEVIYRYDCEYIDSESMQPLRDAIQEAGAEYRVVEHTADVGIEVTAPTAEELFAKAGRAFSDLMFGVASIRPEEKTTLGAEAVDLPGLMVAFLSELLFLFEVEKRIFHRFEVRRLSPESLFVEAWGERFDATRHTVQEAVKAVTYHQLRVEQTESGWIARVILDL